MLDFNDSLDASLKLKNTTAFWVLKLYYADEDAADYIGVSDKHRTDGSDFYHGIVSSWGGLNQSLNFQIYKNHHPNI